MARGLGMKVLFAATPQSECREDEVEFEASLGRSDTLTLHVPLTSGTRGLINAGSLAAMKPDAVLINTGRGALLTPHVAWASETAQARLAGRLVALVRAHRGRTTRTPTITTETT